MELFKTPLFKKFLIKEVWVEKFQEFFERGILNTISDTFVCLIAKESVTNVKAFLYLLANFLPFHFFSSLYPWPIVFFHFLNDKEKVLPWLIGKENKIIIYDDRDF